MGESTDQPTTGGAVTPVGYDTADMPVVGWSRMIPDEGCTVTPCTDAQCPDLGHIGAYPPGEGLRAFLVPGLAQPDPMTRTVAVPADYAPMLADLAARLALIDPESLPPGANISLGIDIQPRTPDGVPIGSPQEEIIETAVIDAVAAVLLPGVAPIRRHMTGDAVHYQAYGRTPAGLGVKVYTSVKPTDVERAEADAVQVTKAVTRDVAERAALIREAGALGHGPEIEGGWAVSGLVRVTCSCGKFQDGPATYDAAGVAWRRHAGNAITAARQIEAAAQVREAEIGEVP